VNDLGEVVESVRSVAPLLPVGIFVTDPDGLCAWVSDRWSELSGLGLEDALGTGWAAALHDEDRDRVFAEWTESAATRTPFSSEYRFRRPDETTPWVRGRATAVTDSAESIIGYVGSIMDISDRVASETRFRLLAENATDTIVRADRHGRLTYVSPMSRLLGYEPDELIGLGLASLIHSDDLHLFADRLVLFEKDELRHRRFRIRRRDGDYIWVHGRSQRAIDPDTGVAAEIQTSLRDVTAEVEAEQALRESEERFRCLADATSNGVCISEAGVVVSTNAVFATLLGYEPEELVGMPITRFVEPEHHAALADRVATKSSGPLEFVALRKDGTHFEGAASGRTVSYQGREVRVTTITDLTDVKRTVTLDERRRVARDLHDGLAHELAFVASKARTCVRHSPTPEALLQIANAAERALDEARRAITLLSSSAPERLEVAIAQTAEDLGSRHGMTVSLDLSPTVVVASDTAENLLRILREAMTNAGRHGHARRVAVRLWQNGDVHLVVDDDGCGFVVDQQEHQGFGLLSMQERAHALGGKLLVQSSPGRGTCVEVVV
jgi:PAS domain S-box-containing protein